MLYPGSQRENHVSRYSNVAIPRYIEIATSTSSNVNEFVVVATAALQPLLEPQLVKFDPVEASHVRVTVIDSHTGGNIVLDEIEVFEVSDEDSVVDESVLNLASPDLGGVFVQASSGAWKLVDGTAGENRWSTKAEFPIDLVLAFREDREALVKSVVLYNQKPKSGNTDSWPKEISVAVSSETPASGFREIGRFEALAVEGKQSFPVNAQARYLRLRINSNHGDDEVSLDELWIFEGREKGYDSILAAYPSKVSALRHRPDELPPAGHAETEPNDEFSDASNLVLGELNLGVIDSPTDVDHYRIPSVPAGPLALTLEINGYPDIRTYVALFDPGGEQIAQFNPGETTNDLYRATWHLSKPGEYGLKVSRAPMSMVIAVGGKLDTYEAPLKGLLDNLKAPDEITVIRTSKKGAEYLLPDFTSDEVKVMAAVKAETSLAAKLYKDDHNFWKELAASNIRKYSVRVSQGAEIYAEEDIGVHHGLYAAGELLNTRPGNRVFMELGGVHAVTGQSSVLYATTLSRVSQHIATTTGGQIFSISSENEAEEAYTGIMDYLRSSALYGLSAKLSSLKGTLEVQATGERIPSVSGPSQVALILDASGSMKRRMGERRMIDIAKDVLGKVIQDIPDESLVALRVFGHRINEGLPGDCQDTEALVPFSQINRAEMRSKLSQVDASGGTTLIGHALRQLTTDFDSAPGPKLVVLVTDGEEECEPDLPGVVTALQARGIDVRLNIVGFALGEERVKQSMADLADLSGGRYFDAKDAASLELSVAQALDVPYRVVDSNGKQVATGSIDGGPIAVIEGEYSIVVDMTDRNLQVTAVRILANQVTRIELNKDGQEVGINIREPSPLQSNQ
ncbi:MAG: hypothetical protein DRR42_14180 [Gammaproteobacteria bacterium]|nr:MAG: hypothetical protein DRR42_14180 [Gammaproteobacteria bacterium]